jgi:hypothetical protein
MRLFLDLHLSDRAVGGPLRADGHDVVPGAPEYAGVPDDRLLHAVAEQGRIVVTCDRRFVRLVRLWAFEGLQHSGVLLLVGMGQNEYGAMLRAIRGRLAQVPEQDGWRDVLMIVGRSSA